MDVASGVRLHVADDGCVHMALRDAFSCNSGLLVDEFVVSDLLSAAAPGPVCVLTADSNADLLCKLYAQHRLSQTLWVGSPISSPRTCTPARVLDSMLLSARQHWHVVTVVDVATYELMHQCRTDFTAAGALVLSRHPLAAALTFLPGIDRYRAARLLCAIVDPRWYVSSSRPGRWSGLYTHLGLMPANVRTYLAGRAPSRRQMLAYAAIGVWYGDSGCSGALTLPGNFLWRCLSSYLDRALLPVAALLRTTARFIRYLAIYWLSLLVPVPAMRFRPEEFFNASEALAFKTHELNVATGSV